MGFVIGAIGAIIGALGAGGVAWWTQRNSSRSRGRRAARVLLGEATALRAEVERADADQTPLPDAGGRLLQVWRDNVDLGELPYKDWKRVTNRVHTLNVLLDNVRSCDPGSLEAKVACLDLLGVLAAIESALSSASR